MRLTHTTAMGAGLSALALVTGLAVPGAASASPGGAVHRAAARATGKLTVAGSGVTVPVKHSLWTARFEGTSRGGGASAIGVSADGSKVYITGAATQAKGFPVYVTAAYDAATGARSWASRTSVIRENGGFNRLAGAPGIAVSPDGSWVNIDGGRASGPRTFDESINAATGAKLWQGLADVGRGGPGLIGVSPDGSKAFITDGVGGWPGVTLVTAFDGSTGAGFWMSRRAFPGGPNAGPAALAVNPNGMEVVVVGNNGVVADNAATGSMLWSFRYKNRARRSATAVTVSPDGSRVFVTGATPAGYLTTAYSAMTRGILWKAVYPGLGSSVATSVAVSPDGTQVFVTGHTGSTPQYATVAYNAATGSQEWVASLPNGKPVSVAASPDGTQVFVTGTTTPVSGTPEWTTLAYSAATGTAKWIAQYQGPAGGSSTAAAMAVSAAGPTVFVTGSTQSSKGISNFATVAYRP